MGYNINKKNSEMIKMAKDAVIKARVESSLKDTVENIFDRLGLSPIEAITLFYKQVELRRGLPFVIELPK